MPKVSVIVPVYNTEKYLDKCLDSLVNQTLEDIEIIIVNDGSTDNSEVIIKQYEKKFPNKIRYFKKDNEGIASARNFGIEHSNGNYVAFVDSDDFVDKELFFNLDQYMQRKIDIIKYKLSILKLESNESIKIGGPIFDEISGEEAFNRMFSGGDVLFESPCLYLFSRKYLIENKFKFLENTYHEDFGLIPLIILKAKTVKSTDIYGYYYIQSNNSITRNENYDKTYKKAYDLFLHYDNMISMLENCNVNKKSKDNMKIYFTNSILLKVKELNNDDKKKFIKEIKKRKLISNIKIRNLKQLIKKIILKINVELYLKIR